MSESTTSTQTQSDKVKECTSNIGNVFKLVRIIYIYYSNRLQIIHEACNGKNVGSFVFNVLEIIAPAFCCCLVWYLSPQPQKLYNLITRLPFSIISYLLFDVMTSIRQDTYKYYSVDYYGAIGKCISKNYTASSLSEECQVFVRLHDETLTKLSGVCSFLFCFGLYVSYFRRGRFGMLEVVAWILLGGTIIFDYNQIKLFSSFFMDVFVRCTIPLASSNITLLVILSVSIGCICTYASDSRRGPYNKRNQ